MSISSAGEFKWYRYLPATASCLHCNTVTLASAWDTEPSCGEQCPCRGTGIAWPWEVGVGGGVRPKTWHMNVGTWWPLQQLLPWCWFSFWHRSTQGVTICVFVLTFFSTGLTVQCTFHFGAYRISFFHFFSLIQFNTSNQNQALYRKTYRTVT